MNRKKNPVICIAVFLIDRKYYKKKWNFKKKTS